MNIIFTKEGILSNFDDLETLEDLPDDFDIKRCYNWVVDFSQELTVEEFFFMIEPYIDILDQDFASWNHGAPLREYFDEMNDDIDGRISLDIHYLEMRRGIEFNYLSGDDEGYDDVDDEPIKYIDDSIGMYGIGIEDEDVIEYSLDFVAINTYKDAVMILNKICLITRFESNEEGDVFDLVDEFEVEFTFHDLIKTFIEMLSINGTPEDRDELFQEIISNMQATNEIEKSEVEEHGMDEIMLNKLKKQLEEERDNENFKVCAKLTRDISVLQKKIDDSKK